MQTDAAAISNALSADAASWGLRAGLHLKQATVRKRVLRRPGRVDGAAFTRGLQVSCSSKRGAGHISRVRGTRHQTRPRVDGRAARRVTRSASGVASNRLVRTSRCRWRHARHQYPLPSAALSSALDRAGSSDEISHGAGRGSASNRISAQTDREWSRQRSNAYRARARCCWWPVIGTLRFRSSVWRRARGQCALHHSRNRNREAEHIENGRKPVWMSSIFADAPWTAPPSSRARRSEWNPTARMRIRRRFRRR